MNRLALVLMAATAAVALPGPQAKAPAPPAARVSREGGERGLERWRAALGLDDPVPATAPAGTAGARWYLERGVARRAPRDGDADLSVAFALERLMRDGGVPGFYDGQFAEVRDRFGELARLCADRDVHHVLRFVAVMALQEADGSDEALAAVLLPLVMRPEIEWDIEYRNFDIRAGADPIPAEIPLMLDATLSRYARFALAKRGLTGPIREKIAIMQHFVEENRGHVRTGLLSRRLDPKAELVKETWFSLGYYHQQFDDYERATYWFRTLCEALPGDRSTRWAHYNLACIAGLQGHAEEALAELRKAYEAGFLDLRWMDEDGDLVGVRELPGYRALREEMARGAPSDPAGSEGTPEMFTGPDPEGATDGQDQ